VEKATSPKADGAVITVHRACDSIDRIANMFNSLRHLDEFDGSDG
jgi:hypothetical protein